MKHALSVKLVCVAALAMMITGCTETQSTSGIGRIRLEHVAINVPDPVAMATWYNQHLGMKIMREGPAPVNMRFIADPDGNMMLELYNNPPEAVPDYANMNPLLLHIAFMVDDVDATKTRLLAAGATVTKDIETTEAGDKLMILRDPWGVPIQFLTRSTPMLNF